MEIIRIEPIPRRPERVRVFVTGGRRSFDLGRLIATEALLRPGLVVDDAQLAMLLKRDLAQDALDRALHFLENRPRSEREIRTRLTQQVVSPDFLDQVIERLRGMGLVDDSAFAKYWIENRERFSPRGARALKAELRHKGLADETIEESLVDAVDDEAGARVVALGMARKYIGLDRMAFRQRLYAQLARRGFDFDAISSAIDAAWHAVADDRPSADDDTID